MAEFILPEDRTQEEVEQEPELWWEYAAEEHGTISLEERVTIIEDVVAALLEM